jgi:LEA14-like dessication related protein
VKKKSTFITAGILFLMVFAVGCKPKPKVTVVAKRLVIKKISLKELVLSVRYLIKNPHSIAITIKKVDQILKLKDQIVATGKLHKEVKISSNSSETLDVIIVVPFSSSLKPVGQLILGKEVAYSLKSKMVLDTALGKERRTLVRAGKLHLPIKPGGGLVGIKNIKLEGSKLKLNLIVKIPRPKTELMATKDVDYIFSIENSVISKGKIKLKAGKGDFHKVIVPVTWPMLKGVGWSGKLLLGSAVKTYFKLQFNLGDETEFVIENQEDMTLKKLSPVNILKKLIP